MNSLVTDCTDHWLRTLAGAAPLRLPVSDAPGTSGEPTVIDVPIPGQVMTCLQAMSGNKHLNLFKFFLGGLGLVLWKYTSQTDLVIAVPPLMQDDMEGQRCGTLYCRLHIDPQSTIQTYFQQVHTVLSEAHVNSEYDEADFTNRFIHEQGEQLQALQGAGCSFNQVNIPGNWLNGQSVVFELIEEAGARIRITCRQPLWPVDMLIYMANSCLQLMQQFKASRDQPLAACHVVLPEDQQQWQQQFAANTRNYDTRKTVIDLFLEKAHRFPLQRALLYGQQAMTFGELNALSYRISRLVGEAERVAICMQRSPLLVAAIVGILRAGAAYIPLGEDYPGERIRDIISDTGCTLVLHDGRAVVNDGLDCRWIDLTEMEQGIIIEQEEQERLPQPGDLAYIIFSSGTTGKPKGIIMEHGPIMHLLYWYNERYNIRYDTRIVQLTNIVIDIAFQEIFSALINGLTLYIPLQEESLDKTLFIEYLNRHQINFIQLIPDMLFEYLAAIPKLPYLHTVLCGGDKLGNNLKDCIAGKGYRLYNIYGQTETAIDTVGALCVAGSHMQFNDYVPSYDVWIMDEQGALCAPYVPGEIGTGGAGLARGYVGDASLTAAKFIPHPFQPGARLYRTGDLARRLPDGSIELLGRKDEQVKIRGFRIELTEIERALQAHPEIDRAVVVVREQGTDKELMAYFTGSETLTVPDLRNLLRKTLPAYMIPAGFVRLSKWPLTAAGKVDRKQLAAAEGRLLEEGKSCLAPRNEMEAGMQNIWQQILGRLSIGVNEGFFEAGGDSIKILRLMSELKKVLGISLSFADVYKLNTIENMAAHVLQNRQLIEQQQSQITALQEKIEAQLQQLKQQVLAVLPNAGEIADVFPMSDIEKGIVYEYLLRQGTGVYHDLAVHERHLGDLVPARLERALELLADKHAILRTSFNITGFDEGIQLVHRRLPVTVPYYNLADLGRTEQEAAIREHIREALAHPFDITQAPLWRMTAFNCGQGLTVFVAETHHAILDGWSDASFMTELNNVYLQLEKDPAFVPSPLRSGYRDFVIRQEIDRSDPVVKQFWQDELTEYTRLNLFTTEMVNERHSGSLLPAQLAQLEQTAASLQVTIKDISLAAYLYLLKVISGSNELVAGLVTNTRPACDDSDQLLGCFLNTIPFKIAYNSKLSGSGWVQAVHSKTVALKAFERLSMFEIARLHGPAAGTGNPFFDTMFNYVDFYAYDALQQQTTVENINKTSSLAAIAGNGVTNTYFDLDIDRTGGGYHVSVRLNRKLDCRFSAERVSALYLSILNRLITKGEAPLQEMNCLLPGEADRLLYEYNATQKPYAQEQTIVQLLEEQAARTPDAAAILCGETTVTYSQLEQEANQLAHYLVSEYGLKTGCLAGVLLPRTEKLVVAILAVLKTGSAYVPMDIQYPKERIDYIVADSQCDLVIDEAVLIRFYASTKQYSPTQLQLAISPANLAYVIYTSGSTGKPKGVMIEHRSVNAFIHWCRQEFAGSGFHTVLAATSVCFDLSVFEIFYPLSIGKKLRVLTNALQIPDYLQAGEAVLLNTVPSVVASLLTANVNWNAVRVLNMAGEAVPSGYNSLLNCHGMEVRNLYGPSEDTTYSTVCRISEHKPITIGRPIANTQLYIMRPDVEVNDDTGEEQAGWRLSPTGVTGEICIAGAGLARGYLNRVALTREKFVPNPFRPGERMYLTGDLGRWLNDGSIEFVGRRDNQVKIRGFRIEPGEIEQVLLTHPGIGGAAVVARSVREGDHNKELIAYITSRKNNDRHELVTHVRQYITERLPAYMVPAHWVVMDALPLTPNGKTDRKRLPAPDRHHKQAMEHFVAPANDLEQQMVTVWKNILNREQVGVRDNFFDSGGHSLVAMRLLSCLYEATGMPFSLQDLYNRPTIRELATGKTDSNMCVRLSQSYTGKQATVYCVPPVLGDAIIYKPLAARFEKELASYGFTYPGLMPNDNRMVTSIEQLAALFSEEVKIPAGGPVILLGYSMGAAIAFEMAKLLEPQTGPLTLLLIDFKISHALDRLVTRLRASADARRLLARFDNSHDQRLKSFLANNLRMLGRYVQKGHINSNIILVDADNRSRADAVQYWKKYTSGTVTHHVFNGNHWEALAEAHAGLYTSIIRTLLYSSQSSM